MSQNYPLYTLQTTFLPAGRDEDFVYFSAYFSPRIYTDADGTLDPVAYNPHRFPNWTAATADTPLLLTAYSGNDSSVKLGSTLLDTTYERDPHFRHDRRYSDLWAKIFSSYIKYTPYQVKHKPELTPEVYNQREEMAAILQKNRVAVYPSAAGMLSQEIIKYFADTALGHGGVRLKDGKPTFTQAGEVTGNVSEPLDVSQIPPQKGFQNPPTPSLDSAVNDEVDAASGSGVPKKYDGNSDSSKQEPEFHALLSHIMETPALAQRLGLLRHFRVPWRVFEEKLGTQRGLEPEMFICLTLSSPGFPLVQPIVLTNCVHAPDASYLWDRFCAKPAEQAHLGGCLKLDGYALSPIDANTSAASLVAATSGTGDIAPPLFRTTGLYLVRKPVPKADEGHETARLKFKSKQKMKLGVSVDDLTQTNVNLGRVAQSIDNQSTAALARADGLPPATIDLHYVPVVIQDDLIRGYTVDIAFDQPHTFEEVSDAAPSGHRPPQNITRKIPSAPFFTAPEWVSLCSRNVSVSDPDSNFHENFADEGHISLHAQVAPAPMYGWLTPYRSPLSQEPEKVSPTRNWYLLWTATASYLLYETYPDLDPKTGHLMPDQPAKSYHVPENLRDGSYVCVNVRLPEEWVGKEDLKDENDYLRAYEIVSARPLSQASLFGSIISVDQVDIQDNGTARCLISVRTSLETFGPRLLSASLVLPKPEPGKSFKDYVNTWVMASGNYGLSSKSFQPVQEMEATFQEKHDDRTGVFAVNVPFLNDPILVQASGGEGLSKGDPLWLVLNGLPPVGSEIYPNAIIGKIQTQFGRLPGANPGTPDPIDFTSYKITASIENNPTTFAFNDNCIYEDELAQPFGVTDPAEANIQDAALTRTWRPFPGDSVTIQSHLDPISGQPVVHRMIHDPACVIGIIDQVPESENSFDLRLCVLGQEAIVPTQKKVTIFLSPDSQLQGRLSGHRMPPINVLLAVFCESRPNRTVSPTTATATRIEVFSQPEEESSTPVLRDETDSGFIYRWVNSATQVKTVKPVDNIPPMNGAPPANTPPDFRLYLSLGLQPPVHGASLKNIDEQLLLGTRPNLLPEGLLLNGKRIAFCANSETSPPINKSDSSLYSPPSIYALKVSLVGVLEADSSTPPHYIFTLSEDQEDDRWHPAGAHVSTPDPPVIIKDLVFKADPAHPGQNEDQIKPLLGHVVSIEILFDANGKSFSSANLNDRTIRGRVKTIEAGSDGTTVVMDTLDGPLTVTDLDSKATLSPRQLIEVRGQVMLVQDEPSLLVFAPQVYLEKIVGDVAFPPSLTDLISKSPFYKPAAYQGRARDADGNIIQYIFMGSPYDEAGANSPPLIWGEPTDPQNPTSPDNPAQELYKAASDADKSIKARYPIFSPSTGPSPEKLPFPKAQFLYVDTTVFKFQNNNLIVGPNSNDTEPTNPWDDQPSSTPPCFGNLRIEYELPDDSVLPLRFGRRYQVRMRMVDLAGNRPGAPDKMRHNGLGSCVVRTGQPFMRFDPVLPPVLTDVHTAAPLPEPKAAPPNPKKPEAKVRPPPSLTPSINTQLYNGENEAPRYVPDDLVAIVRPIKKENRPVATPTTEYEGPPNNPRGFGSKSDRFVALPVNYEKPVAAADVSYPANPADVITEAEWKFEPPPMDLRLAEMTGEIDRLVANVGNPCPTLEAHTLVKPSEQKRHPRFSKLWQVSGRPCLPDTYSSGVTVRAIRGPLPNGPQLFSPRRLPPDVRGKLRELHDEFAVFDYAGDWPRTPHVPCVLQPGEPPSSGYPAVRVWLEPNGGNRLIFSLPVGEVADVEISSFLVERNLARMAAYLLLRDTEVSWMTPLSRGVGDPYLFLKAYCLLGLHRSISPARLLRLVHAVHTPNRNPSSQSIELSEAERPAGEVKQTFRTVVGVHRNSTGSLILHSTYQRYEDSIDADLPNIPAIEREEMFCWEDELHKIDHGQWQTLSFSMLPTIPAPGVQAPKLLPPDLDHGVQDTVLEQPLPLWQGEQQTLTATQVFPDTRHYRIYVQTEGRTRFTEYFPTGECVSRYSTEFGVIDVPASVPPDPPVFAYAQPLFSWSQMTTPNAITRTRTGNAVRIFLRRPWFSSGRDEMLAITFDGSFDDNRSPSRIGGDPIWRPLLSNRPPVTNLTPDYNIQSQQEGAWVFTPKFCIDRKLWFVDFIVIESKAADIVLNFGRTPFIQLSLARYQPHAISDCKFSKGIRTDFITLLPERKLTLTRNKTGGTDTINPTWTAAPNQDNAKVKVAYTLEKRPQEVKSDLSWTVEATVEDQDLPLPTIDPGYEYRVVVRETENLEVFSNDSALPSAQDVSGNNADLNHRLTYLDIFPLPGAS